MVESERGIFPFPKLKYSTFDTVEVLMHVEYEKACKFIFAVNKAARIFLQQNILAIRNGFSNEGLFYHKLYLFYFKNESDDEEFLEPQPPFYHFKKLEKLYFEALKKNI